MNYKKKQYDVRYFIGIEYEGGIEVNEEEDTNRLWQDFKNEDIVLLDNLKEPKHFIGLQCYPPDFDEVKTYDYYAMVETNGLDKQAGFTTKKLPAGTYIQFKMKKENINEETKKVYQFIEDRGINIHYGFDYEDYEVADTEDDEIEIYFSLLLEND
ncbi:MAG: effector binding domain-containing protein [Candidatus Izimaplasma sp.]|nr:effector binding domain-containing protein [Candidatus Izimaplasma bacterium]